MRTYGKTHMSRKSTEVRRYQTQRNDALLSSMQAYRVWYVYQRRLETHCATMQRLCRHLRTNVHKTVHVIDTALENMFRNTSDKV